MGTNQFSQTILTMKFLAAILLLATLAQARPRYMMVPFDDEYETPQVRFVPHTVYHHRTARSAFPDGPPPPPGSVGPAPGSFAIPQAIRAQEELIASASGPSPAIAGGDAVDYGAYTGGYGAFGWYSDHPNHEGIGHRR